MSDELRLPKSQLFLICACRFPEPVYFSIHVPFIYFMVRDFKMTDEAHIGYYASLITSAFAMAQFISGMPWGMLSDRFGRKPMLLIGLLSTTIGFFMFGLSKSFAWAITTKILTGLFNGNVSILKSMLSEMTEKHNASNRTRAFSLLQVTFGVGSIVGAALGGYLSEPVRRYPKIFGNLGFITDFLIEYPYFLPCFIAACLSSLCWLLDYFFLKETLIISEEQQPLLQNQNQQYDSVTKVAFKDTLYEALTYKVLAIIILYAAVAFELLYFDELLPTWSATPRDSGGLGFESSEIGTILSFAGIVMLFFQVFLLHQMTSYFGLLRLFQAALIVTAILALSLGLCRFLYLTSLSNSRFWVWLCLAFGVSLKALTQSIIYTLGVILLNNSIEKHNLLGFINGFSQCCNAAMRTLSPAVTGYIWSSSIASDGIPLDVRGYVSWAILGVIGFITFLASMQLNSAHYSRPHASS